MVGGLRSRGFSRAKWDIAKIDGLLGPRCQIVAPFAMELVPLDGEVRDFAMGIIYEITQIPLDKLG